VISKAVSAVTETQPTAPARFELPARAASGLVMAAAAISSVLAGGLFFAVIVALGGAAALREWHRLVNLGRMARETIPTVLALIAVISLALMPGGMPAAWAAMALGAVGAAALYLMRRAGKLWPVPWHAFGAFYVGVPALALIVLRQAPHGAVLIGALFVAVWMSDICALFAGRLIGGPKLAAALSPNKTWAGFFGGLLGAAAGEALYILFVGGAVPQGVLFGIIVAFAGVWGDLFESWVKRQFQAKDSGRLIPGHGGMLDRIDSLLFAAPVCAVLILLLGFNPLTGAMP
jgi:phosphatidate cytidylyltransferase